MTAGSPLPSRTSFRSACGSTGFRSIVYPQFIVAGSTRPLRTALRMRAPAMLRPRSNSARSAAGADRPEPSATAPEQRHVVVRRIESVVGRRGHRGDRGLGSPHGRRAVEPQQSIGFGLVERPEICRDVGNQRVSETQDDLADERIFSTTSATPGSSVRPRLWTHAGDRWCCGRRGRCRLAATRDAANNHDQERSPAGATSRKMGMHAPDGGAPGARLEAPRVPAASCEHNETLGSTILRGLVDAAATDASRAER